MEAGLVPVPVVPVVVPSDPVVEPLDDSVSNGERKVYVKLIISNAAAGSIIGKGGSSISEIQAQSGARMQLSRNNDFFPGSANSTDRVLLIVGSVNQMLTALHLVLSKLSSEPGVAETMLARDGRSTLLRMLVPAALAGSVIGKSGTTIRSFCEDSKAQITVSPRDKRLLGSNDRIVKIIGHTEALMRAVALIVTKLLESPNYLRFTSTHVDYTATAASRMHLAAAAAAQLGGGPVDPSAATAVLGAAGGAFVAGGGPAFGAGGASELLGAGGPSAADPLGKPMHWVDVTVPVPEARVGAIIGKGGEIITQLKSVVGVKIRISDRDDFVPGTRDRKVTISGTPDCVQIARLIVQQKISQAGALH